MPREKTKCMRGIIKCARGNKGLRREIKGTRAEEEMQRLRWTTKGADSGKGRNKMHDGEIKCMTVKMKFDGRNKRITGENKRHKS